MLQSELTAYGKALDIKGLILIGDEGFNLTISGEKDQVNQYRDYLLNAFNVPLENVLIKESISEKPIFKRFKVQIRKEIVTLGLNEIKIPSSDSNHLAPTDFHQALQEENVQVIDTRNWYETDVGKFKKALDFRITEFREFPDRLESANLDKSKKTLIYCTGGIRCEKAIEAMRKQGFEKVYQLEGGILKYLEEYPNKEFEGECFVFDHRVAVDQNLKATKRFGLCPHCGQPALNKITCLRCDHPGMVCDMCIKEEYHKTCSKNCAYHYKLRPGAKGPHQVTVMVD